MPRLSYHLAASRADAARARVQVVCECPVCDEPVTCVVNGTDVTVPGCADKCAGMRRFEMIEADARERAQGERDDYRRHLMDGGR